MAIAWQAGTKIYLALGATDMRKGFDGLSALVGQMLKQDPFSEHLFVFRSRRGDRLKALYWDGSGLCLYAKRLERGRFVWPRAEGGDGAAIRAGGPIGAAAIGLGASADCAGG